MIKIKALLVMMLLVTFSTSSLANPTDQQCDRSKTSPNLVAEWVSSPFAYTTLLCTLFANLSLNAAERLEIRQDFERAAPHRKTALVFLVGAILPNAIFAYQHYDSLFPSNEIHRE